MIQYCEVEHCEAPATVHLLGAPGSNGRKNRTFHFCASCAWAYTVGYWRAKWEQQHPKRRTAL